jgi:hypothetical protein
MASKYPASPSPCDTHTTNTNTSTPQRTCHCLSCDKSPSTRYMASQLRRHKIFVVPYQPRFQDIIHITSIKGGRAPLRAFRAAEKIATSFTYNTSETNPPSLSNSPTPTPCQSIPTSVSQLRPKRTCLPNNTPPLEQTAILSTRKRHRPFLLAPPFNKRTTFSPHEVYQKPTTAKHSSSTLAPIRTNPPQPDVDHTGEPPPPRITSI